MKVKVVLESQPDGGFTAYSGAFPGCVSEGETEQETVENFLDALEAWLEVKSEIRAKAEEKHAVVEVVA